MPTPQAGESQDDFVSRCIPIVLEDGTAEDQEQAAAVCYSMWREAREEGKMTGKQMERKTFSGIVTKADEEQGVVEAFFAVFGNVDQGKDIVHPGAFAKTFAERGGKVKVLDNHQTDSIMRAIGKPLVLKEVGRDELPGDLLLQNPDATGGAFARVQMLMDTPEGKGAFVRLRDKAVTEWSFGYDALDFDFSTEKQNGGDVNVRNLRQVKLYEISPVLFAMNEATITVSAKSDGDPEAEDDKAVWSTAFVNDLPDGSFLYIAPGGEKDEDGKTVPRNLRYFPYKDASGKVDLPHLRNAIGRIPQSNAPGLTDAKKEALQERARRLLEKEQGKAIEFGEGKYLLVVESALDETTMYRLKALLNEWIDNPDDKAFLVTGYGDVKLIRLHEQPIIHNHYTLNAAKDSEIDFEALKALAGQALSPEPQHRAGPDDAPPPEARPDDAPPTDVSQRLKELYALRARLDLLEVEGNENR